MRPVVSLLLVVLWSLSVAADDRQKSVALLRRAGDLVENGEIDNALHDYTEAIRLHPKNATGYREIARLRATCSNERYRDGKKAVEYATQACERSAWNDPNSVSVLAAAYAEDGDFTKAVKWQEEAVALSPENEKTKRSERLQLYRAKMPFREPQKK